MIRMLAWLVGVPALMASLLGIPWSHDVELHGVRGAEQPADPQRKSHRPNTVARHHSPIALAAHPDLPICLTSNRGRRSVSLVNWETGEVLDECDLDAEPSDVMWIDAARAAVSANDGSGVHLLQFKDGRINRTGSLAIGWRTRGLALSSSGTLLACVFGDDRLVEFDPNSRQVLRDWHIEGAPERVVVTTDGKLAAVVTAQPATVTVVDLPSGDILDRTTLFDEAYQPGIPLILPGTTDLLVPILTNRQLPIHAQNIMRGWVIDNRIARLDLTPDGSSGNRSDSQRHLALDEVDRGAGDVHGLAVSPDGRWMVVSCSGTHDLAILDLQQVVWPPAHPGDHLIEELEGRPDLFRRVPVGGRPLDLEFVADDRLLIANHLLDCIQVFDLRSDEVVRSIALGRLRVPDPVRRGEQIFYDASRSFHGWFSCHSCHTDGHTAGQLFDSINDETYDTLKLTPTLRGVTETGPWTWHGWQKSLSAAMRKSLTDTLHTEQPVTDEDVADLLAFLSTLKHPERHEHRSDDAIKSLLDVGRTLFHGKAGCSRCHRSPFWTSGETYDVGLNYSQQFFDGFNPPSLRGLRDRRRFLHDGRARSLKALLSRHHRPDELGEGPLTERELAALIRFLESL